MEPSIFFLESGLSLTLFYLFFHFMARKETLYSLNRFLLLGAVVFSFLLPLKDFTVGSGNQMAGFIAASIPAVSVGPGASEGSQPNLFSLTNILLGIYATGILIFSGKLLAEFLSIYRLHINGRIVRRDSLCIILTGKAHPPFSFFSHVFINEEAYEESRGMDMLLKHEQAHVRHWHSVDILLLRMACVVQWFNPFMWLLYKMIKEVHEYEADRYALHTSDKTDYQNLLVAYALGSYSTQLANSFHSSIKNRIIMLQKRKSFTGIIKAMMVIPLAVGLFLFFACSKEETGKSPGAQNELKAEVVDPSGEQGQQKNAVVETNEPQVIKGDGEEDADEVFFIVEEMPTFQGKSLGQFRRYLQKKIEYPEEAKKQQIEGRAFVQFVVNPQGQVEQVKVVRSSGHQVLDNEAIRVIKNSPGWEPGKQRGQFVHVVFTMPVTFQLGKK